MTGDDVPRQVPTEDLFSHVAGADESLTGITDELVEARLQAIHDQQAAPDARWRRLNPFDSDGQHANPQ